MDSPTGYSDVSRFCYKYRRLVLVQDPRPTQFLVGFRNVSDICRKNIDVSVDPRADPPFRIFFAPGGGDRLIINYEVPHTTC